MDILIILHGWRSSKEKWQKVKELLEKEGLKVIVPDLPGFKPATELKRTWNLDDYTQWLRELTENSSPLTDGEQFAASKFFLLGHSFGGRMAIKFAVKYPRKVQGLILLSAAGLKKKKGFSGKLWELGAKAVRKLKIEETPGLNSFWQLWRKFFYYYILRKTDYFQASGSLKETIKNVLAEDLTPLLKEISVPVLIVWGKKDKITPLRDAYVMRQKIKNSRLEILENIGHTAHLENPELLAQKLKDFIVINELTN